MVFVVHLENRNQYGCRGIIQVAVLYVTGQPIVQNTLDPFAKISSVNHIKHIIGTTISPPKKILVVPDQKFGAAWI